jgi:microcystin-dependent protein
MADNFLAEIRVFPFNFAPVGWASCNGQILPISQNTALFSLLGTYYGGDGKSNFALPNLQGSIPVAYGQGVGLSPYSIGESGGEPTVSLLLSQMPAHTHSLLTDNINGPDNNSPANAALSFPVNMYSTQTSPVVQMAQQAISPVGGSQPHNNLMPYLTLNFCIALQGIYPARS